MVEETGVNEISQVRYLKYKGDLKAELYISIEYIYWKDESLEEDD